MFKDTSWTGAENLQRRFQQKKRGKGRPPKCWTGLIKEDTGLPLLTAEKYAKDRRR